MTETTPFLRPIDEPPLQTFKLHYEEVACGSLPDFPGIGIQNEGEPSVTVISMTKDEVE